MVQRYGRHLVVVVVLALALALSGCGNSKKGNGYGLAPSTPPTSLAASVVATG